MIQDLDETLKTLLIQKVPIDNSIIDIKFEMPNQEWENKLQKPTINLFLYEIRENLELRSNEKFLARQGTTGAENIAPVRMDLTYMITVWTKEIADEHRLLGNILTTLLRYPIIPKEVFQGVIVNQSLPLRAWVTQPEQTPKVWDFWGPMDGRFKAGLSFMVTIAIETVEPIEAKLVTETVLKLEQLNSSNNSEGVAGRV